MNATVAALKFLAGIGQLYRRRFLTPLWDKCPRREEDDWEGVTLFLEGYAFARQGAPSAFIHAALDAMRPLREAGLTPTSSEIAHRAWAQFSGLLKNKNLNYANNPLCPKDTEYTRTFGREPRPSKTYAPSVFEFLLMLQQTRGMTNMIAYAKTWLEQDKVAQVYQDLGGIGGIGRKIASLFLRDVVSFYNLSPPTARHLLQPVDVWVRAMSAQLMDGEPSDEEIARWIVQQSTEPEAVNQGMWYFGSQIAGSQYRVSRSLKDLTYAKALVDEHIENCRQALSAMEGLTL